jgi:hypothetical protein
MTLIQNTVVPNRLLLVWQAQKSEARQRYLVGELTNDGANISLRYLNGTADFDEAVRLGFSGHPAFEFDGADSYRFENSVIETLMLRLPPQGRSDFGRFLEIKGLESNLDLDDFTLLGYTGAKLPDDGFEIVHPFDNAGDRFQLVIEIAGFRYHSEIQASNIQLDANVFFEDDDPNPADSEAIRVKYDGKKIGYVDRIRKDIFNRYMSLGYNIDGRVFRKNGTDDRPLIYVLVSFSIT